ncbi:choice-of-anchor F family protein [Parvibaculum sp.]|uniref:choice-of-anchor F family protein n=1 Tax=Parvibaculum sp. TaxID=2024848 RepID=UPI0025D492B4|nr:choice-of-anchor F family protein [Parvibaculum sp.]
METQTVSDVRADLSSEAGVLTMDDIVTLVTAQALGWEGLIGTEGQDPLQRAFFPGGLFGDGGAEGEAGFFTDPQRAGFFFAPVGTDTLETNGMFGGYAALFGNALLSLNQVPDGLFFDSDDDPTTEASLIAWQNAGQWYDTNGVVISDEDVATLLDNPAYEIAPIEDLANSNVNWSFDIGDLSTGEFTIRFVPVFAPIVAAAGTEYQFNVAAALDSANIPYLAADPEYLAIIAEIEGLPTAAEQQLALERAGTSYLRNFGTQGMLLTRMQAEQLFQMLAGRRTGNPNSNNAIAGSDHDDSIASMTNSLASVQVASNDPMRDVAMMVANAENGGVAQISEKMTAFISGAVSTGNIDGTVNGAGADYTGYAITAGLDYEVAPNLLAGAGLSYGANDGDIDDSRGELNVEAISVMTYLSYGSEVGFNADVMLGYSWLDYDNERRIVFGGINQTASSNTDGTQTTAALRAGYNFAFGDVIAGPSAQLQHLDLSVDGYTETGAGVLSMTVNDMDFESTTLWLGGQVSMPVEVASGTLRPSAHLHWVKEFEDGSNSVGTTFTGGTVPFTTPLDSRDENYIRGGVGVSSSLGNDGMNVALNYDGTFAHDDYSEHRATLSVQVKF